MTGADADGVRGGNIQASLCIAPGVAPALELSAEKGEATNHGTQLKALNEQLAAANISYRLNIPRLQAGAVRLGGAANRCKRDVADALSRHGESLTSDCAKLLATFQAQRSRQEALEDENQGLQSEVDDLERRARAEVAEVQRLKKELERKSELYEEIKAAFDEERENLEKAQQESRKANSKLQEATGRLTETEEELQRRLREEKKRAGDAEGDLKRQLEAAQSRVQRAEEKWAASESQLRGVEVTLRDALWVHEERVRERETERQEAEAAIARERDWKEEEMRARKEAEEKVKAAEERAQVEISRAAKAVQVAKERQLEIDAQAAEVAALREKTSSLEEDVASLRQKMNEESAKAASDKRTGVAIERCSAAKLRTQVTQLEGKIKEQRNVHKARCAQAPEWPRYHENRLGSFTTSCCLAQTNA
uniref:Uncharacterized protein n=1 Tax=Hemiselmis andersenii TaxID=464988 RepID=A0A6U4VAX6_HEMAN|mmetsp:Transcript_27118/g.65992  ORF Transcript_27118/g.65992 Transcript_27118/m.65992 type:complete len:424 (+) Transcript_27118:211-1482(+)